MQQVLSQADIEKAALELGAPQASVYKWRERGIPYRWRFNLLSRFSREQLENYRTLPREHAPEQAGAAA
jgi:ATP phosphoribosyltransferase regulatory subunit HisZ